MKKIIAVFCAVFSFATLAEESIYTLKNADFQQKFAERNNSEELVNMYHEFSFQNPNIDMPRLDECRDYTDMCSENHLKQHLSMFSHFKNQ